jgi:ketosteroid isomerase-like protein
MKRLGLVAALIAIAVPALGQVDAKVEKELLAGYGKVVAALKKKDAKGVVAYMTPNATMKQMGQTMTRAQFEPMLKQQIQMVDVQSASIKFSKLVAKGDTANAEYTEYVKAKTKTPDGKGALMEMVSKYKGTFKKMGGEWKLHSSETIGAPKMTMNGKPMNPGAPPK